MPPEDDSHANMSFGDHLEELRTRLIVSLLGLLPILIVCLVFGRELLDIIIAPAQASLRASGLPAALQATSPVETFGAYLRVGLIATVLVGSPWL
ncbi:MAG: twin-arginine translocase subunit TatC, partial [Planctomycetota bacterium]